MVTWVGDISPASRLTLIETAQKSISAEPNRVSTWLMLGNLLLKAGRFEEAAAVLSDAARKFSTESEVHFLLADAHKRIGTIDSAIAAIEMALALAPRHQTTMLRRFDFYVTVRCWDRVTEDLERVAAVAPTLFTVILAYAHSVRMGGDPKQLLTACNAALARKSNHTGALHYKALALSMLGRGEEARDIIGLDDFVSLARLPPRVDQHESGRFLDAVAGEILQNPTLVPDPYQKATRDGLQTRVLMQADNKAMPIFLRHIRSAVDHYLAALPKGSHPFSTTPPSRVRLNPWAVVYPQDGRQASHFHARGWISGVAYVTAPRNAGESRYHGPLVLGESDSKQLPVPAPWGTREIEPVPGRIVLFPSFIPHATRPSGVAAKRICVAFDVVAA